MRAIGFHEPGGPEVLEVLDLPDPVTGPGEVKIRVHAAAVNPTDTMRREGRRATGPEAPPPPHVPGMDAAGVLTEIGDGVVTEAEDGEPSDLQLGQDVMALVVPSGSHGAYSEQVVVPARSVVRIPAGANYAQASTLPMNGLTARLALDTLGLEPGSVLVVTGAAGTMGAYAVQLAKQDGLVVVADAAQRDQQLVTDLGADLVLARGEGFADRVREHYPNGVHGGIDGALLHDPLAPAVQDGGTIITLRGYDEPADRGVQFRPIHVRDYAQARDKLQRLRQLVEKQRLTLRVAETMPGEHAAEAHRRLAAGGVRGRIVLEF